MMTPTRAAYLVAAQSAAALLADPAVAAAWTSPSALESFAVSGLAGHLSSQVLFVDQVLTGPPPDGDTVPLLEHYARVRWIGADLDADISVTIRRGGEETAADGAAAMAARAQTTVDTLREALPAEPANRRVHPPAGPWALTLDDFLISRMMEIAVHSDDLAVSVNLPTPPLPPEVAEPVLALLTSLAVRRHGFTPVLRALSRAERAPATIAAF